MKQKTITSIFNEAHYETIMNLGNQLTEKDRSIKALESEIKTLKMVSTIPFTTKDGYIGIPW